MLTSAWGIMAPVESVTVPLTSAIAVACARTRGAERTVASTAHANNAKGFRTMEMPHLGRKFSKKADKKNLMFGYFLQNIYDERRYCKCQAIKPSRWDGSIAGSLVYRAPTRE